MTKVKVYAPNEGYAATVGAIRFEGGVATVDADAKEMGYFRRAGYGIGKKADAPKAPSTDARDYAGPTYLGTPLRDAAVDPKPSDFLPPTNAGEADPHGPLVVAPGIHGVGPKPIRAGEVFVHNPAKQEKAETALAETVLVEGNPATSSTAPDGSISPFAPGLTPAAPKPAQETTLMDAVYQTPNPADLKAAPKPVRATQRRATRRTGRK